MIALAIIITLIFGYLGYCVIKGFKFLCKSIKTLSDSKEDKKLKRIVQFLLIPMGIILLIGIVILIIQKWLIAFQII